MKSGRVAGIDVHKSMLAVAVGSADLKEDEFEYNRFGTTRAELRRMADWLTDQGVTEVVMESTAQYWKTVWLELETRFPLSLAQARSVRGPKGRKSDLRDAARLVRRLLSKDLVLSYVPAAEQRKWRLLTRTRVQMVNPLPRLTSRIEGVLEEGRMKLSCYWSDLLGLTGRRILEALAEGQCDAEELVKLVDPRVQASREDLMAALEGGLGAAERTVLQAFLEQVRVVERHIQKLEREAASLLQPHQEAIARLCEIPGINVTAAQQIVAELGPAAGVFDSPAQLASWIGCCPGQQESAGENQSERSAKGNWAMRRLLPQIAWAASRTKDCIFQDRFRRWVPRLGVQKALWALAHKICRVIWIVLHRGERYIEHGVRGKNPAAMRQRAQQLIRGLRRCGYSVQVTEDGAIVGIPG